jgi:hypothetical protein
VVPGRSAEVFLREYIGLAASVALLDSPMESGRRPARGASGETLRRLPFAIGRFAEIKTFYDLIAPE